MDNTLYVSMDVLDVVECNIPCACENASMNINPYNCDDMLLEFMGVVDKLLKKGAKKFQKNLSKLVCENDDLIAKLNEAKKLVEKYKKLIENSLEKLKKFECLNMDLDAKLVLSNKLVNDLKSENESLKMYVKCLIAEPVAKTEENICCNPILCLLCVLLQRTNQCTFLHTKEIKKWRERLLSLSLYLGPILGN